MQVEKYFYGDPSTCRLNVCQLTESLTSLLAAPTKLYISTDVTHTTCYGICATAACWDNRVQCCFTASRTLRLAYGDMSDPSLRCEEDPFQSVPLHMLARGCVGAGHRKCKLGAVMIDLAVFRHLPVRIGKPREEFEHHDMNGLNAVVFSKKFGVVGCVGVE